MRYLIVAAMFAIFTPTAAQTLPSARNDAETLLSQSVGVAWDMLRKNGEFHPYAAAMRMDGQIVRVLADTAGDEAASQTSVDRLIDLLATGAKSGAYEATALFYHVGVDAAGGNMTDAVAAELDHVAGYSAVVFHPYNVVNGRVRRGKVFGREGPHRIFGQAAG